MGKYITHIGLYQSLVLVISFCTRSSLGRSCEKVIIPEKVKFGLYHIHITGFKCHIKFDKEQ